MNRWLLSSALALVTGCASVPKAEGHDRIAELVRDRAGFQTGWSEGTPPQEKARELIGELLKDKLTADEAVRIALANSPTMQATFEEVGIAQNEMLQASLLSNPSIGIGVGFPDERGAPAELSFSLVQELLDLALLPARRSIASAQFSTTVLRVANEALVLVAETRSLFAHVQAAEQLLRQRLEMVAATEASMKLALLQFEAGNVTPLEVAIEESAFQEARADYARDEVRLLERREQLSRLLGLWGESLEWEVASPLPALPESDPIPGDVEAVALRQRLDVSTRRQELELTGKALSLSRASSLFGRVEVGVDYERESDGLTTLGPSLVLELPIFDQRQALIGGLEAQQRQAQRRLDESAVNARSEVRVARAQLLTSRRLVEHYERALLPAKRRVLEQSQLQYNAMSISPYQLFEARRDFAQAHRELIEALADYWSARAELERAIGGPLKEATK